MDSAIALEKTDRVGVTSCKAAVGDLQAEASAFYLTEEEYGFLKMSDGNAADAVRTMKVMDALEIFHLADAQTHFRTGKESVHE
jgi:hypothetical protein